MRVLVPSDEREREGKWPGSVKAVAGQASAVLTAVKLRAERVGCKKVTEAGLIID